MPVYEYQILGDQGNIETGIVTADSIRQARDALREQGKRVIRVATSGREKKNALDPSRMFQRRYKKEIPMITRQFATLVQAGLPLTEALSAVIMQIDHEELRQILIDVRDRVIQGSSLADALENYPAVFIPLYISMVRAGEASGNLDMVLDRMALYLAKVNKLKNQVLAALTYPVIVLAVGFVVVSILVMKVVPKITAVFEAQGQLLPFSTRFLIRTSHALHTYWWAILLGLTGMSVMYTLAVKTRRGRAVQDRILMKLPVFGPLIKKQSVSRFVTALATLLRGGIPLIEALKIVKDVTANMVLSDAVDDLIARIMEGSDLGTPLKKGGVFPSTVGYMASIGEESGQLEDMLEKVSELYEEEVEVATQRMTSVLEPATVILLAGVVGFIVMAILKPIMMMTDNIL